MMHQSASDDPTSSCWIILCGCCVINRASSQGLPWKPLATTPRTASEAGRALTIGAKIPPDLNSILSSCEGFPGILHFSFFLNRKNLVFFPENRDRQENERILGVDDHCDGHMILLSASCGAPRFLPLAALTLAFLSQPPLTGCDISGARLASPPFAPVLFPAKTFAPGEEQKAARLIRRAKLGDIQPSDVARSIFALPPQLWRGRVSISTGQPLTLAHSDQPAALSVLTAAAVQLMEAPRVCTAWGLPRATLPGLGGAALLAAESLHENQRLAGMLRATGIQTLQVRGACYVQ